MIFDCPNCGLEFDAPWTFGANVTCPHCREDWETDYEIDSEESVSGPWITGPAAS